MATAVQALERDQMQDRRKHEAQAIGHAIFAEIRDLLPREVEAEVHERLMATLYRNGVLLVRDTERTALGLEACDERGWTPSERVKFEQDKIAAMHQMASFVVKLPDIT
ncbi:hypothetical protein HGG71_05675 [Rhodobacteraceae bacterium R_SAG2]|nr:hypothetical protein [Rhodobacteraceae bacterium R_SAG2]